MSDRHSADNTANRADTLHSEPITEVPTQDLALAAFLSLRHPIVMIDCSANGRQTFWFPHAAERDVNEYYRGKAMANARDLLRAFRDLKDRVLDSSRRVTHATRRGGR